MITKMIRAAWLPGMLILACLVVAGVSLGGFTLKRPAGMSLEKMREEYCAAQVALLREVTSLVADVAVAQSAMIGDMQSFIEGGSAPCSGASCQQLAMATGKTQQVARKIEDIRHELRAYAGKVRLFVNDEESTVTAHAVSGEGVA